MEKLLLKDVRCFRGEHTVPLAPLTIVVGENSTGKSTLLALTRIAWDIAVGIAEPDFNEDPFQLGVYDEIAHYHGGRGKRATSFSVGSARMSSPRSNRRGKDRALLTVLGTFSPSAGQPVLTSIIVEKEGRRIEAVHKKEAGLEISFSAPSGQSKFRLVKEQAPASPLSMRNLFYALDLLLFQIGRAQLDLFEAEGPLPSREDVEAMADLFPRSLSSRAHSGLGRPLTIAPIRSRPKRTYDPLRDVRSPEGEHVPMLLARLSTSSPDEWKSLAAGLTTYGRASGLFDEVTVKRFTGSESAPFQLRVKLAGQKKEVNLMDVGYGVSQVLPILVDCLMAKHPTFFLMQQPEVHLHPRAQAELGTLLASLVNTRGHSFFVETHSDHLVDRIRLAVKERVIGPEMVSIIFAERSGTQAHLHSLTLDAEGNLVGQPESYRQFFLEEELRIIS